MSSEADSIEADAAPTTPPVTPSTPPVEESKPTTIDLHPKTAASVSSHTDSHSASQPVSVQGVGISADRNPRFRRTMEVLCRFLFILISNYSCRMNTYLSILLRVIRAKLFSQYTTAMVVEVLLSSL